MPMSGSFICERLHVLLAVFGTGFLTSSAAALAYRSATDCRSFYPWLTGRVVVVTGVAWFGLRALTFGCDSFSHTCYSVCYNMWCRYVAPHFSLNSVV